MTLSYAQARDLSTSFNNVARARKAIADAITAEEKLKATRQEAENPGGTGAAKIQVEFVDAPARADGATPETLVPEAQIDGTEPEDEDEE